MQYFAIFFGTMNLFNEAGQRAREVIQLRTNPDGSLYVAVGDLVLYKYMKSGSMEEMLSRPLKETSVPAVIYALSGQHEATFALLTGDAQEPISSLYHQARGTDVDQWEARG
ncbi:MAG TPA: hypothetical protein VGF67_28465 [Ktedonobacteraceae bacterium]|jgi:hypothetical protein